MKNVLIIEDDVVLVEYYREALIGRASVDCATSQRQAIGCLMKGVPYQVVVLDGYVPLFDGESQLSLTTDLIFRIQTEHPEATILATSSDPNVVERYATYGCVPCSKHGAMDAVFLVLQEKP